MIAALLSIGCWAQSGLTVFRSDTVHEIRITIERADWFDAMSYWHDYHLDSAQLVSMSFDGQTLDSVGMHMRGNLSFGGALFKKPFKLDMNAFVNGQEFDGLRSLCLNNDIIDRSHLHTSLSYKLLNEFGVPAPRTGFANLYINDELYGLYTLVEQVNKSFVGERFGNNDGDLWKSYMCYWNYLGPDTAAYAGQMELKEAFDSAAYQRLIHLFELVATTPDPLLADTLSAALNMDHFLKTYAVNAATAAEDNGPHNWWLYWQPDSARYAYIPWDYDLTFFNVMPAAFSEDTTTFWWWGSTALSKKVTRSEELMARYYDHLCDFRTTLYTPQHLTGYIDSAYALLRPIVLAENTWDNCPIAVFDSAYYAFNHANLLSQWGLHAMIAEQGALLDSTLEAHGVACAFTGVPESRTTENVLVFPNPAIDRVQVMLSSGMQGRVDWKLFDALGSLIRAGTATATGSFEIDLRGCAGGPLTLMVQHGDMHARTVPLVHLTP